MNNRQKIIVLAISIICLTVFAVYWYIKDYIPKYRWTENYLYDNQQPYGLKLFYDLLQNTHSKENFVLINEMPKKFLENKDSSALYVFIGASYTIDSASSRALTEFVKHGNNVFISSNKSEHEIFSILTDGKYPFINYSTLWDSLTYVSFDTISRDSYIFDYKIGKKNVVHSWFGIEKHYFHDSLTVFGFEPVSWLPNKEIDCFRVKYGKGWFLFNFDPIFYTNYNLSKVEGYKYVNRLLSAFNKPKILWDEYSKSGMITDRRNPSHESALRFILSEKSLRWSWYLLCTLVLIFVIFNSKRKQAFIPLLPENKNTTIEYIQSIAILHHQNNSSEFLADEIMKQFLSFIRYKYGLSSNLKKKKIAHILSPLSGVSEEMLDDLFNYYNAVKCKTVVDNKSLLELYRLTEYFYQNCK